MTEIIGVKFKDSGKAYYFSPNGIKFKKNDKVIVKTTSGLDCGVVAISNEFIKDKLITKPLKTVVRKVNAKDLKTLDLIESKEKRAMEICCRRVEVHKLDMKPIKIEYSFDMKKVLIYFIAENRVDFRNLVRELAEALHARIELRQVGVRDQAKLVGGVSKCGREFCCKSYLNSFHPVSIKMAKQQGMSLNPTKISGTCGRLMCCLAYEQNTYANLLKKAPRVGNMVETSDGIGKVTDINVLSNEVKVLFEDNAYPSKYNIDDITVIKNKSSNKQQKNGKKQ